MLTWARGSVMFRQYQMTFGIPNISFSLGKKGVTSNDSRDIMNGPSAEATRSRD